MIIQIDSQKEIIVKNLNSFFSLDRYTEFCLLDSEELIEKHGGFGFSFSSFFCVRFSTASDIFKEICEFLPEGDYFIIPISLGVINIFKMEKREIESLISEHNLTDFIIIESKLNWLLVYDRYRKLFGLGGYIKNKMKTHINTQAGLQFGKAKLMFWNADIDEIK